MKPALISRLQLTVCVLLLACLLLGLCGLALGSLALAPAQLLEVAMGTAAKGTELVVLQWRLPRVVAALILGGALGASGAIFQSLLRNPLGSPDILGFNTGAYSGTLLALAWFNGTLLVVTAAATAGGLTTALLVYLLAWRNGISTLRLILVGIGVRALLVALNSWLIINASLEAAMSAGLWNAGSLNGVSWHKSTPALLLALGAMAASLLLSRRMRLLEMGDDTAYALGVPVERSRLSLMLLGVTLTAAATAVAGPISFVALAAPQIARRLSASQRGVLPTAALTGAALLLAADLLAQHLFTPYQLPVGLITVSLGGLYLIALLIRESRKK